MSREIYSYLRNLCRSVELKYKGKTCRYHKKPRQRYDVADICGGFCADAYHAAYPYCLRMLYTNAAAEMADSVNCPRPEGIVMRIVRRRRRLFHARRWVKAMLSRILFPIDWADWNVEIRVAFSGACPYLKIGQTFRFNINDTKTLCPASFHSLFPRMTVPGQVWCPDHEGIRYEMDRMSPRYVIGLEGNQCVKLT